MKAEPAWWRSSTIVAAALCALALTSCAVRDSIPASAQSSSGGGKPPATTVTVTEDEIASLPQWQRELLADPGWDQPAIALVVETPLPVPKAPAGNSRSTSTSSAILATKHTSATDPLKGEYNLPCGSPYGCDGGCNGNHQLDRFILDADIPDDTPYPATYVEKRVSSSNHFNLTGGYNNNALCSIYQIFWNKEPLEQNRRYSEAAYRADGGPDAGGNPCNAEQAYVISGYIWWKYNQQNFNALPGLNSTAMYNILIAPSSDESPADASSANSTARYQSFYMGSLNEAVYGGAQIVSIESSTSNCNTFRNSIGSNRLFYTNPIYGVLLKRWQDSVLKSMTAPNNDPWDGDFGWPVQGPTAFNNGGSTLTAKGAYYAWGLYFERGFMWWIDYINNTNVPDEAQAYSYTGSNVFCKGVDDKFEKMPTIYYGGTGPLGVCVIVEASLSTDATHYEVSIPTPPAPSFPLDMHAHGYGGTPRAGDAHYKHYTWAFHDGTIGLTNGVAYDDSTKYVQHTYTEASNYTVRVQVIDANGTVAYGDSLPIHVNYGGGAA